MLWCYVGRSILFLYPKQLDFSWHCCFVWLNKKHNEPSCVSRCRECFVRCKHGPMSTSQLTCVARSRQTCQGTSRRNQSYVRVWRCGPSHKCISSCNPKQARSKTESRETGGLRTALALSPHIDELIVLVCCCIPKDSQSLAHQEKHPRVFRNIFTLMMLHTFSTLQKKENRSTFTSKYIQGK